MRGLTEESQLAISSCENRYSEWFGHERRSEHGLQLMEEKTNELLLDRQSWLAQNDQILRDIQRILPYLFSLVRQQHRPLEKEVASLSRANNTTEATSLRYLNALQVRESLIEKLSTSGNQLLEYISILDRLRSIVEDLGFEPQDSEIVDCPLDQTKMRVPTGKKRILVTCPSCKYRFVVNTCRTDHSQDSRANSKNSVLKALKGLLTRNGD
jgi:hypothetical protein